MYAHPFYTQAETWCFLIYEIMIFLYMIVCLNYYVIKQVRENDKNGDLADLTWDCHFKWHFIWMAILSLLFWLVLRCFQTYAKRDAPYVVKRVQPTIVTETSDVIYDGPRRGPY